MVLLLVCRYVVLLQNENLHATEEKKRSCALATHKDRNSCPTEYKSNHTNQVDINTTFAFSYKLYSTFGICFGNRIRKSEKEWERERDFTLFQVKRLQWWQYIQYFGVHSICISINFMLNTQLIWHDYADVFICIWICTSQAKSLLCGIELCSQKIKVTSIFQHFDKTIWVLGKHDILSRK